jgi:hypothetical protein
MLTKSISAGFYRQMNDAQLAGLYGWFDRYTAPFLDTDEEGQKNIRLKIDHTQKVCAAMAQLAAGEQLSAAETNLALATALLHDVGRFPQYQRWRTFRDSDSDNHARLAIDVIRAEQILAGLDPAEQLLIEEAVRFHNLFELPANFQSPTRLFIDLIRDADKLDIWRVFVELLALPAEQRASAALLGFADLPDTVSAQCVAALAAGSMVRLDTVTCVNDYKLLQISWVYDLHTDTARRLLLERELIPALAATLPKRADIEQAVAKAVAALST